MPKKKKQNVMTPKQKAFVREYIIDHNGTQAAIRAGFAENSAKVTASRLLTKANIKESVKKAQAQAWDAAIMTRREALARLSEMGRANLADFMTPGGSLDIEKIYKEKPVLSEFKIDEWESEKSSGIKRKVKLVCPDRAIVEMSKMQGFYEPETLIHEVAPEEVALEKALEKKLENMSVEALQKLLTKLEGKK